MTSGAGVWKSRELSSISVPYDAAVVSQSVAIEVFSDFWVIMHFLQHKLVATFYSSKSF